jgi:ATP phosphoribosyltransferase regulatory subunit
MSAWVLPDHLADVLPYEARQIEELRRVLLDSARTFGYELVMPPMLEHLESLLSGTGESMDLRTFKLVDQSSGRQLGLRADTTPQVARIDAHLLNRQGPTRLCYCGPVVQTQPTHANASREPLQFGAELYGHQGQEADLEILELVLTVLKRVGIDNFVLDLSDVRVVAALLTDAGADANQTHAIHQALARKDVVSLASLTAGMPQPSRDALRLIPDLYGDLSVIETARSALPQSPMLTQALDELAQLGQQMARLGHTAVSVDLADLRGYAYYTGLRFSVYGTAPRSQQQLELLRGGRYDEVGAVFGRRRPAVGFSVDVKELAAMSATPDLHRAIRAPWGDAPGLREAVADLRIKGEAVVSLLPGHENEVNEFDCDRELVWVEGTWQVRPAA